MVSPVSGGVRLRIVDLIGEGTISGKIAKILSEIVWIEAATCASWSKRAA